MKIAPAQKERLVYFRNTLANLQKVVGRDNREDLQKIEEKLDSWAARIAVIGQVKAGKSTFLNAFLQRHDFLPNDVNPWTSVVTNIRANIPGDPKTGACFDFFSESDWDEIINGSNRIRKMAEQLLPGFDGELVKEQSTLLRDRTQAKLGKHYHALLGSKHEYEFITPDLLRRYVCAGPDQEQSTDSPRDPAGKYAALTREANVYMSLPEFQVPAVITDTPGVNDPFLLRDEVTCRSLDRSDVFVVVLSAHQALTDVDIGLIRILVQQDSKDVLIFVNRIDEVDEYHKRYKHVLEDVSTRLREAIPGIEFDILIGSAYLADLVFRSDDEAAELRASLDDDFLAGFLEDRYGYVPESPEDRLLLGSGFEEIKKTLSKIIDTGEGARQFERIKEDIRAKVAAVQYATRREHKSVVEVLERLGTESPEEVTQLLAEEIATIKDATKDIDRLVETVQTKIEGSVEMAWSSLETALNGHVEKFIGTQEKALQDYVIANQLRKNTEQCFEINLTPLHATLEDAVREGFDHARHVIDKTLEVAMSVCCETVSKKLGEKFETLSLDGLPFDSFSSTLAMSKKSIRIELATEKNWAFWKRKEINLNRSVQTMKAIALAEMRPAIEKLVGAFNEAQSERAEAGLERLELLQTMMETSFDERSRRLKADQAQMTEMTENPVLRNKVMGRLQSQLEVLEKRLQQLSVNESALTRDAMQQAA